MKRCIFFTLLESILKAYKFVLTEQSACVFVTFVSLLCMKERVKVIFENFEFENENFMKEFNSVTSEEPGLPTFKRNIVIADLTTFGFNGLKPER